MLCLTTHTHTSSTARKEMPKQVKWNNITEHSRIQVKSPFFFFVIYFAFYCLLSPPPFLSSSSSSGCGPITNDGDDARRLLESRSTQFIFSFFFLSVLYFSREVFFFFFFSCCGCRRTKIKKETLGGVSTMSNNLGAARFIPSKNRGVNI